MNVIIFLVIFLRSLEVLSKDEEPKFPTKCGYTPSYANAQIAGGRVVHPEEYSWLASLHYGNGSTFGSCGGSVIHSRYVLTAAHCVTGERVDELGGLTGVHLGDFTQEPYCDYGAPNCSSYQFFGVEHIKVHWNYRIDKYALHNDIALIRLNRPVQFDNILQPVCLPTIDVREPVRGTLLTVAGWGKAHVVNETVAKRAVELPLVTDFEVCQFQDKSRFCAGLISTLIDQARTPCSGDSGGPIMQQRRNKMIIEGIVSFIQGRCINNFFAPHYTRVRNYMTWIEENMDTEQNCPNCTSIVERKFPPDCGYTPMYRKQGHNVRPDEYSWLAVLLYENLDINGSCVGSVINSRYVLTSVSCVDKLTRVRLGDYDENGKICDYGTANCTHYQEFGVEKIIPHSGYNEHTKDNDIALVRLDREIQFGTKMKPICLPFGSNRVPQPRVNNNFTVTGWFDGEKARTSHEEHTKLYSNATLCSPGKNIVIDNSQICVVADEYNSCYGNLGSPLMKQYNVRRVVLEGIYSYSNNLHCADPDYAAIYTRVSSYFRWLDQNMYML